MRTTVRVVFLDFDGVLNSHRFFVERPNRIQEIDDIDPVAVALVNDLLVEGRANVVVSSSWRVGRRRTQLCDILNARGFTGRILGMTPRLYNPPGPGYTSVERGHEIQKWLDVAKYKVESFVILDDDGDMAHLKSRLVRTNPQIGLTPEDMKRALSLLEQPV